DRNVTGVQTCALPIYLLQVLREVSFREGLDAIVMGLGAANHALAPPVLDQALADLCSLAVEAVERPGGDVEIKLRAVLGECLARSEERRVGREGGRWW